MTAEQQTAFEADANALAKIETVSTLHIGRPASTLQRAVSQSDFDYKLTVIFDDIAGHDIYQDHAIHHEFIDRQKAFFATVRVFDSE